MNKKSLLLFGSAATILLTACKKDDPTPVIPPTENTTTIKVNFAPTTYTLFSFKNNAVVANTDSVSTKWDFAIRLNIFLVNSHASGPGNAGVILQDGVFDNLVTAPTTAYAYDTSASQLAIKGTWYDYNPTTRSFTPKAGKVFVFRTADNKYAKMEILEVTYDPFVGATPDKINYRFRFSYQADGSTNLNK